MKLRIPPKAAFVIDILQRHGHEAYVVGGCVRDSILARDPQDWDITTSARPEEVRSYFRRTVATGMQHGTVTVMIEDQAFEVTTFRIDGAYSDGRHPDAVVFTPSLLEDLKRRDFTINAMAYNDKEGLIDPFGGMADLQRHLIRCVGDPDDRFTEDALRIMRALRFSAQLGFTVEEATLKAISGHAERLKMVSAERIQVELVKLLTSDNPMHMRYLYETGITSVVLPEFDPCMVTPQNTPYHCYNVGEHILHTLPVVPADKVLRLTMLLHDIAKPLLRRTDDRGVDHFKGHAMVSADMAYTILKRLKFDNDTISKVVRLVRYHDVRLRAEDAEVRRGIYEVGPDLFPDYLTVQRADTAAKSSYRQAEAFERIDRINLAYIGILGRKEPLSLKDLAIRGDDLLKIGIRGKAIGTILETCLMLVLKDPRANDRDLLMTYAESVKGQTLS